MRHNFRLVGLAFVVALAATALVAPGSASAACTTRRCVARPKSTSARPPQRRGCSPTGCWSRRRALPPGSRQVIAAANKIRSKPYIFGGGHARWWDRGYDCSGAVSFALHGGKFLESPLPSGPMASWAEEGEGRWITVWTNAGHAYAEVAGFRWDTSGDAGGETGPRWHEDLRDNIGFVARHPAGY